VFSTLLFLEILTVEGSVLSLNLEDVDDYVHMLVKLFDVLALLCKLCPEF
jgi:hypothetical protein